MVFAAAGYPSKRTAQGVYRIISATDIEASFRQHDDDLTLGYNVALATTATRICAVVVATSATPDSEATILLTCQHQAASLPLPPYYMRERAGGWGTWRARRCDQPGPEPDGRAHPECWRRRPQSLRPGRLCGRW